MREEQMNILRRRGMSSSAVTGCEQPSGVEDVSLRPDGRLGGQRNISDFKILHGTYLYLSL